MANENSNNNNPGIFDGFVTHAKQASGGLYDTVASPFKGIGSLMAAPFSWEKGGGYDTSALKNAGNSAMQFGSGVANTIGGIGGLVGDTLGLPARLFGTREESVTTQSNNNDPVTYAVKSTFGTPNTVSPQSLYPQGTKPPADWISQEAWDRGKANEAERHLNDTINSVGWRGVVNGVKERAAERKAEKSGVYKSLDPNSSVAKTIDFIVKSNAEAKANANAEVKGDEKPSVPDYHYIPGMSGGLLNFQDPDAWQRSENGDTDTETKMTFTPSGFGGLPAISFSKFKTQKKKTLTGEKPPLK